MFVRYKVLRIALAAIERENGRRKPKKKYHERRVM
jgi:hypothetical protein